MKELIEICAALKTLEGNACALATVIHVEGSAYRRPAARMLMTPSGQVWGMVSGGCLEHDVLDQGRQAKFAESLAGFLCSFYSPLFSSPHGTSKRRRISPISRAHRVRGYLISTSLLRRTPATEAIHLQRGIDRARSPERRDLLALSLLKEMRSPELNLNLNIYGNFNPLIDRAGRFASG